MRSEELKDRTKKFAINIIKLVESFPKTKVANVIGAQLIRSATSIGANYRAACRSRSHNDFISKMAIVEEEADETLYWLELLVALKLVSLENVADLFKEAQELTAIFSASRKTAKAKRN